MQALPMLNSSLETIRRFFSFTGRSGLWHFLGELRRRGTAGHYGNVAREKAKLVHGQGGIACLNKEPAYRAGGV